MKVLITGANGALGREMTRLLLKERVEHIGIDIAQLDITDSEKAKVFVYQHLPDVILHFAAVSDVDGCEKDNDTAFRVNALSSQGLAKIASEIDAKMLYTSTNFVFDGNAKRPYVESSRPNPINEYGRTKLLGERYLRDICRKHFIIRTSWLFGQNAKTYVTKFLSMKTKPSSIGVIRDQLASFTYIKHLAKAILQIIRSEKFGIYHVANKGIASWFDFATRAKKRMKFKAEIMPIRLDELNLPAKRPLFSPLSIEKYERLFSVQMASWEEAQEEFIRSLSEKS